MSQIYTPEELNAIGFGGIGSNVSIDRTCRFYGSPDISIGSNVRIDAYTVISSGSKGVKIGNHVHLACFVSILGNGGVVLEDFCGLSARVSIFSANDDYRSGHLTGPTVPESYRNVVSAPVVMRKHVIIGAWSVILPGVTIGLAASVGALTFVNKNIADFQVVVGHPMRTVGVRDNSILEREACFLAGLPFKPA